MEKLGEVLAALAAKLGTTVEYLWVVLVKQARIEGICSIIQYGVLALAIWGWSRWIKAAIKRDMEPEIVANIVVAIGLGVITIVAFFGIPTTVSQFLNPEYWALNEVLKTLGK